jgi:hypothetical protein
MNPILAVIYWFLDDLTINLAKKEYFADFWDNNTEHMAAKQYLIDRCVIKNDNGYYRDDDVMELEDIRINGLQMEADDAVDEYNDHVFPSAIEVKGLVIETKAITMPVLPRQAKAKSEADPRGLFRLDYNALSSCGKYPKSWKNYRKDQIRGYQAPIREVSALRYA